LAEKLSFQKLNAELDQMSEEPVAKSEGAEDTEPKVEQEEEKVEDKQEEKAEEPKAEEKEEKQPEKGEEDEEKPKSPDEPIKAEDIEKSEKPKKEEAKEDDKEDKGEKKDKKKVEDKEEKEDVKKSAESTISEADLIGAFEMVVKSFGKVQKSNSSLDEKVESLSKSVAELIELVKESKVEKSVDVKEIAEGIKDKIEKSVQEEEVPEGKAVEAIVKSEDGVVVPEVAAEPVEEEPKPFVAEEHIDAVTSYYITTPSLNDNDRTEIRHAVNRVKRGEPNEFDIKLFKGIVGYEDK